MNNTEENAAKSLLKKRKLRATPARTDLLNVVQSYGTAIPYTKIQEKLADTDRITLYRTLNIFLEKGILHKAYTSGEETYYAVCGENCTAHEHRHNHVHFKCTICENVTCEKTAEEIRIDLPGFRVETVGVFLTGVCGGCL